MNGRWQRRDQPLKVTQCNVGNDLGEFEDFIKKYFIQHIDGEVKVIRQDDEYVILQIEREHKTYSGSYTEGHEVFLEFGLDWFVVEGGHAYILTPDEFTETFEWVYD